MTPNPTTLLPPTVCLLSVSSSTFELLAVTQLQVARNMASSQRPSLLPKKLCCWPLPARWSNSPNLHNQRVSVRKLSVLQADQAKTQMLTGAPPQATPSRQRPQLLLRLSHLRRHHPAFPNSQLPCDNCRGCPAIGAQVQGTAWCIERPSNRNLDL